ncbi:hypothetical protein MarSH_127 [Marseillevirus Shanghai 1]|nr:hypothetical protein MarSH_127 [Marseillevirus Shanghai 1]
MTRLVCVSKNTRFLSEEGEPVPAHSVKEGNFLLSSRSCPVRVLRVENKLGNAIGLGGTSFGENQEIHVYKKPSPCENREKLFSEERKVDLCLFPQTKILASQYDPTKYSMYRRGVFWKFRETEEEPFAMARACAASGRPLPEILLKNSRKTMEQSLLGVLAASPTFLSHPPFTEKLRFSLGLGPWEGTKKTLDDICVGKICSLNGTFFPSSPKTQQVVEILLEEDVAIFLEDFTVV